jgi:succinate dehydrogenase/fumarate reductase-like Fe-S protein
MNPYPANTKICQGLQGHMVIIPVGCGICTAKCPVQAIDGTFTAAAVFAAAAAKKTKAA